MTLILHSSSLSFSLSHSLLLCPPIWLHILALYCLLVWLFLCYCVMCFGTNNAPFLLLGLFRWGVASPSLLLPMYPDSAELSLTAEHRHVLSLGDIQSESRETFVNREASQKVKSPLASSGGQQKNDLWKLDFHASKDGSYPDQGRSDKLAIHCVNQAFFFPPLSNLSQPPPA